MVSIFNQIQFRRAVVNAAISPDEKTVITTGRAAEFNPAWIDFDGWFMETDSEGKLIRPDEDDNANPYYVDFTDTMAGCFTTDRPGWGLQQRSGLSQLRRCGRLQNP